MANNGPRQGKRASRAGPAPLPQSDSLPQRLEVRGARMHNLKSVNVDIPHRTLVVFTGLSGSGKSSLAFDTIFAEGHRRSVQSLSTYARQFLGQFDRPEIDSIRGLCSAIAIEQETASRNPRSTVGTLTDVYDLLRLLYARIGKPHCPSCGKALSRSPSGRFACRDHPDLDPPELAARAFSFNLPFGVCRECDGLGTRMVVDPALVVPDPALSLDGGALAPWVCDRWSAVHAAMVRALADKLSVSTRVPWRDLPEAARGVFLEGEDVPVMLQESGRREGVEAHYQGVVHWVRLKHTEADSDAARERMQSFMRQTPCPACGGGRLAPAQLAVTINGKSIAAVSALPVTACADFLRTLKLAPPDRAVAAPVVEETLARLATIVEVGLDYLTMDRSAPTLSGGEAKRIRLATQIGTDLFGLLYVLDEPTAGLHVRDIHRLIGSIKRLRDQGNTVLVVEHAEEVIGAADWVVEMGPGAGDHGGEVVFSGPFDQLLGTEPSITGAYMSGRRSIAVPRRRRAPQPRRAIAVHGARCNNLKNIDVVFPLGCLVAVTGVSGSGKSSLVNDILYRALARKLHDANEVPGEHTRIDGLELVDRIVDVDQSPIGRSSRSNPATFTGAFDHIRKVFARTPEARARGYRDSRFSFNVAGGRCDACAGDGTIRMEMQFLADVYVPCDSCHGSRYNAKTLEVRYRDHTIADVLALSVEEAIALFSDVPDIERPLRVLSDVGLNYLRLGQPAPTLSGGEAQRLKLAAELRRRSTGHTLYVLDEPTRGLHVDDTRRLLEVLNGLVEQGHSVIVVEHDLNVVKCADWVIDLGPEGGARGGDVLAAGTPEDVAATPSSHTGRYLAAALAGGAGA